MCSPKITVITVSYNAEATIRQTMKSVIEQTYSNIEYIIIDGNSTDRTAEYVREFGSSISYWESSPDSGIYDAMNKGVLKATGEWIHFLNSGDSFYSQTVVEEMVNQYNKELQESDVVYGNIVCCFSFGKYILKPLPLASFDLLFPISHPCTFVRKHCFENRCFDVNLKIAADFKLLRQLYFENFIFKYIPLDAVLFDAESGVSSNNHIELYKENLIIVRGKVSNIQSLQFMLFQIKLCLIHGILSFFPISLKLYLKKRILAFNHRYKKIGE